MPMVHYSCYFAFGWYVISVDLKSDKGDCSMDKGLKILMTAYKNNYTKPNDHEYELAKAEGYFFTPVELTHDETLQRLRSVVAQISPTDVANAFLYSLSSRQLQYRSALGSYYYAKAIPEHDAEIEYICTFCDFKRMCLDLPDRAQPETPEWTRVFAGDREEECSGYNVFNYERYKWGGVRHTQPEYALFDLEQFLLLPKVTPTEEDWAILKKLLHSMDELMPNQKVSAYQKLITQKRILKSNAGEVQSLLNILGICGILTSPENPCYCERFADKWEREPKEHNSGYNYPVNRWRRWDGVNTECFEKVFGRLFCDL